MGQIKLILPKMGESVAEATITSWLKDEGDKVELEEAVIEIATDKVDSEIPSTHEGILLKKLCKEGDVVQVGDAVAIIEIDGEGESEENLEETSSTEPEEIVEEKEESVPSVTSPEQKPAKSEPKFDNAKRFYSPLVKNIAKEEGISIEVLETISGSGKDGRVTKNDILDFVKQGKPVQNTDSTNTTTKASTPESTPAPIARSVSGNTEIIEMDRMRKLIADHMVHSKQTAPHVTSMVEIDVTNLVAWRNKVKDEFAKKEGFKITFTPLFIEAVAKAIKDFPMINVSVEGNNIIVKKDINIGMAVALPSGNLIVPVVKGADQLNIIGLSKAVNDLTQRARNNNLKPDDIQDGTFTLTNVGTFGNVMGTPIINQPQVAIMSTGVIQKKPAVIETEMGDTIGIRHMMFLSMSYDHRVVDGMLGGSFLRKVGDYLENADINRQIW